MVKISVLLTGLNDANRLKKCIESIENCDYSKKFYEIIYVDGGSSDNSLSIAKRSKARTFLKKGNIPSGRNFGITRAKGNIVAFTDVDCIVDKNWLSEIDKLFHKENIFIVGGPNLILNPETPFERIISDTLNTEIGSMGSISGLIINKPCIVRSIATNNAAYKRKVIEEVGYFDENLVTGEDPDLNIRLRKVGYKIYYTPNLRVWHPRRPTMSKWNNQMLLYGIGRAKILKKHKFIDAVYYFPLLLPLFLLVAIAFPRLTLICALIYYLLFLTEIMIKSRRVKSSILGPIIFVVGMIFYTAGYYKELVRFHVSKGAYNNFIDL